AIYPENVRRAFSKYEPNSTLAYYVVVVEEISTGRVVAAATLVIEWKFIHHASSRGRVEDVVVDKEMRGKKMGALLNRILVALAKQVIFSSGFTLSAFHSVIECRNEHAYLAQFELSFCYGVREENHVVLGKVRLLFMHKLNKIAWLLHI
ncbi:hypothetical protein OESDEN_16637, partial [Oesophagostomum dentatum]